MLRTLSIVVRAQWFVLSLALLNGCVLAPREFKEERKRLDAAGRPYQQPLEHRSLPELGPDPTWRNVLGRALLSNGDVEAAYFDWKAAMAHIPQVANYPNSNVAPSFSYTFSSDNMRTFDRMTFNVGFDSMENLSFPTKVAKAGRIAMENAKAAGHRFVAIKVELQRRVLTDYFDLALTAEKIRIQRDNIALLKLLVEAADARVRAGASQQDLLRAQSEHHLAQNTLANLEAEQKVLLATLNAALARDPAASLPLPPSLPVPRPLPADDARLLAAAMEKNPELAGLLRQVESRRQAIGLAQQSYIPDINPFLGFTGALSQAAGAVVVLPTSIHEINGAIQEARAATRSAQATYRQTRFERTAMFAGALFQVRNSERQARLFEDSILPLAEQTLASSRQAYTTGVGGFLDLIAAQRTLLDVRLMIAEIKIEREKRLAELEALAGVDLGTLGRDRGDHD